MPPILALSVSDKIEQYGAYAGFASVLGLAVLSLLYFAQAREVKRLREWAGRAPERTVEMQDRVQADAQRRIPTPATPAASVAPVAGRAAATPATPAGAQPGAPAPAVAATAAGAAAVTAAGAPTTVVPAVPNGPSAASSPPAPASSPAPTSPLTSSSPPAPRPGQPLRVPSSTSAPLRPRAGAVAAPAPDDQGRPRRNVPAIVAAAGAVVVVAVVVAVLVFGTGGHPKSTKPNAIAPPTTSTTGVSTTAADARRNASVAVLNGTTVAGLAQGVARQLENAGFAKKPTFANAIDQTRSQTLVEFARGHQEEGLVVARTIGVGADAVVPLSPGSRALAGDQATVVVTVGSDQIPSRP